MSLITIFSGSYCNGEEVARRTADALSYMLMDDASIISETARKFQLDEGKLSRALSGRTSIFNKFTHEKERAIACLQAYMAELLHGDRLIIFGMSGLMIPKEISHVLKVCLIADVRFRAALAGRGDGISEKEASRKILKDDETKVLWVEFLFSRKDPWDPGLYDIVLPMDKNSPETATALICASAGKEALKVSEESMKAVQDFDLAAQVGLCLAKEGHSVPVRATNGVVTISINKHVLMLSSLEDELKQIAGTVPGVVKVETKVGSGFYQSDVYRRFDFDVPLPRKVLLVDDEREFIQTLSERLQMRDMDSAVVYDGESALSILEEDEPEVMVLDLKMPGIDGLEVLRRVKTEHPHVEVIVLTGHGSSDVEQLCMEMGACAYLEKPVDVELLTQKMKEAYSKVKSKKNPGPAPAR